MYSTVFCRKSQVCKVHCNDCNRKFEILPKLCLAYEKKNQEEIRFRTLQNVDFKSLPEYHYPETKTIFIRCCTPRRDYISRIDPMFACIRLVTARTCI